jgi:hypothetical protein
VHQLFVALIFLCLKLAYPGKVHGQEPQFPMKIHQISHDFPMTFKAIMAVSRFDDHRWDFTG